jgi:hypothetical protein
MQNLARRLVVPCILCAALLVGLFRAGDHERTSAPTAADVAPEMRQQPSYRLFAAWLAAFNSGDRERYAAFLEKKFPFRLPNVGPDLELRALTGGFDLRELKRVSGTQIAGSVQERASQRVVEFELTLELYLVAAVPGKPVAAWPRRIVNLELSSTPPPSGARAASPPRPPRP